MFQPLLNKHQSYAVKNVSENQASTSVYDLMSRSTISSCTAPRYRATPSALTFSSALTDEFSNSNSFENCGTFPIQHSNKKNTYNNVHYDTSCNMSNNIYDNSQALLLPKFDVSALHFVKTLGTSISGFGLVNLFKMDARLVTVTDYNGNLMSTNDTQAREKICREIDSISRLQHYNVLHIIGTTTSKNSSCNVLKKNSLISCYITEYMLNGNLEHYLQKKRGSIKYFYFFI